MCFCRWIGLCWDLDYFRPQKVYSLLDLHDLLPHSSYAIADTGSLTLTFFSSSSNKESTACPISEVLVLPPKSLVLSPNPPLFLSSNALSTARSIALAWLGSWKE